MDGTMILWQTFFFVSMFLGTLISYLFPVLLIRRQKNRAHYRHSSPDVTSSKALTDGDTSTKILSQCNCIAAGIFLGICFLNLIPYVEDEFNDFMTAAHWTIDYPIGLTTVILGLFLVLTLETLVMRCRDSRQSHDHLTPVLQLDDHHDDYRDDDHDVLDDHITASHELLEVQSGHTNSINHSHVSHVHIPEHVHGHGHSHDFTLPSSGSSLSFFILMFATSVHSVFEGLALGLQREVTKATHLFIGIILHECLVSFALGMNSARIDTTLKINTKFAIAFSSTIPVGIVMGVVLGTTPGITGRIISAIFQGLAAGTFIHVTFLELIPAEFLTADDRSSNGKLLKILLLFIGFSVMALLTAFTGAH